MSTKRKLVSYDDLFEEEAAEEAGVEVSSSSEAKDMEVEDPSDIIGQPGAWDDSALVKAWDSTIAEYRRYHSDILGDADNVAQMHEGESKVGLWTEIGPQQQQESYEYPEPPKSEEDALHKLNMAWYNAGYYAGYYQVS